MEYNRLKVVREITKVSEFKAKNMIFHDPESGSIPGEGKEKNFTYNCFTYKKEADGNTLKVENSSQTLYPKLMYNAKSERLFTPFYKHKDINDPTHPGTEADPLDFVGKMSYMSAAVKIESIFVSSSITLQVKLVKGTFKRDLCFTNDSCLN